MTARGLAAYEWSEAGFRPLVFSHDWQVALLNWEPPFDLDRVGEVERHNQTDEVFALIKGSAILFTIDEQGMQIEEMRIGIVYNVRRGVWHNLVSTRDAAWIIVENRDTHLHDCEYRRLSVEERNLLRSNLPAWVK